MIRRLCRRRYHAGLQRLPFASLHNAVRTTGTTQGTTQCYRDTGGYATCCVPLVERLTSVFLFLSSHFLFFLVPPPFSFPSPLSKKSRTQAAQAAFANGDVDASRAVHAAMALEQHGGTGSEYVLEGSLLKTITFLC